jgi:hypothetical protein
MATESLRPASMNVEGGTRSSGASHANMPAISNAARPARAIVRSLGSLERHRGTTDNGSCSRRSWNFSMKRDEPTALP